MNKISIKTGLRILWAVAAKDIGDAIRNKTILSLLLSILGVIAMYQWGPDLIHASDPPALVLYDAGNSHLAAQLEDSSDIEFWEADSQQAMENRLGFEEFPTLGLVLPPGFDQELEAGNATPIVLSGYVEHWMTEEKTAELLAFFESKLTNLCGQAIHLNITHGIYTRNDGGNPFTVSLLLAVILIMMSVIAIPHLMIEERETHTLDALLISPATPLVILGGKTIAGMFYCLSAAVLVLVLNRSVIVHWPVIIAATLCGALISAALGAVLGNVIKSKQQISLWGFVLLQILILPVVFSVMPEIFPESVSTIIRWIPSVTLAEIIRCAFVAQVPVSTIIGQLLFILACAGVLVAAGIWLAQRQKVQ